MRTLKRIVLIGFGVAAALAAPTLPARATTVAHQDLVDLIQLSEFIVVGRVTAVTDGFDTHGAPYTEVTVAVDEAIRGRTGKTYTFRQFGLSKPRSLGDGRRYLGISPDGWPRFAAGEKVVLFLYKPGAATGFRTTVGLLQGKFEERDGRVVNGAENENLFRNLTVSESLLTPAEAKMLKSPRGPVPADTFVSFVRKAVRNRWIETKVLDHVK